MNWERLKSESRAYIKRFQEEKFNKISLSPEQRYTAVCFLGCQHIGNLGTDYDRMENDARLIANTPDTYCVLVGDAYDNFIIEKIITAIINAKTAPTDQIKYFQDYVTMIGADSILGCISGNHEWWTKRQAGIDVLGMLCNQNSIFYSPHGLVITLKLNDISYIIKTRHQYRYNSSLNLTHSVKRMYDMGEETFDIGVLAHHHQNEISTFERHGKTRVALRVDSYKVADVYGREKGYAAAKGNMPGVILDAEKKKIRICHSVEDTVHDLNALNGCR